MYLLNPQTIAEMIDEQDIAKVSQIMKLTLSSLAYVKQEGEVCCEGIKIVKVSPTLLSLHIEVMPEELSDVLEGQELIRIPV